MLEKDQSKTASKIKQEENESDEAYQKRLDTEQRLQKGETIVDADGKEITLDRLRMESRRVYLKKQQEREVTLLKQSLEDEEELFRNQKLSEAERKRIELGKQIIKMVEKNENKDEDTEDGFYRLPGQGNSIAKRTRRMTPGHCVRVKN
jgi:pre-mRNA-splicing factor ATP-dependent RNA helicase DHX16